MESQSNSRGAGGGAEEFRGRSMPSPPGLVVVPETLHELSVSAMIAAAQEADSGEFISRTSDLKNTLSIALLLAHIPILDPKPGRIGNWLQTNF